MKIKSCLSLEGIFEAGKADITACNSFSQEDIQAALKVESNTVRYVLGGDADSRAQLQVNYSNDLLTKFLSNSDQSTSPVS